MHRIRSCFTWLIYLSILKLASTGKDCSFRTFKNSLRLPDSCHRHRTQTIPVTDAASDLWSTFTFGSLESKATRPNYGFGFCRNRNRFLLPAQSNVGPTNAGTKNIGYRNIGTDNYGPNNYGDGNRGFGNCGNGNRGSGIEGNYLKGGDFDDLSETLPANWTLNSTIFSLRPPDAAKVDGLPYYVSFVLVDIYCPGDAFSVSIASAASIDKITAWTPIGSIAGQKAATCDDSNYAITPESALSLQSTNFLTLQSPVIPLPLDSQTYFQFTWTGSVNGFAGGTAALKWTIKPVKLPRSCAFRATRTVPIDPSTADGTRWGSFVWGSYGAASQANFGPTREAKNSNVGLMNLGTGNNGNGNIGLRNTGTRNYGVNNNGTRLCGSGNTGQLIYGNHLRSAFYEANWEPLLSGSADETVFAVKTPLDAGFEIKLDLVDLWCPGDRYQVFYGFEKDAANILLGTSSAPPFTSNCSNPIGRPEPKSIKCQIYSINEVFFSLKRGPMQCSWKLMAQF